MCKDVGKEFLVLMVEYEWNDTHCGKSTNEPLTLHQNLFPRSAFVLKYLTLIFRN